MSGISIKVVSGDTSDTTHGITVSEGYQTGITDTGGIKVSPPMYIGGDYLIPDTAVPGITRPIGITSYAMLGKSAIAQSFIQQICNQS